MRWSWYAVAIGLPLAVLLVAVALNVGLGAGTPSLAQVGPLSSLLVVYAVRLINPLDGPMGEEPGWRGFALPVLQSPHTPLLSTLILAPIVALWHVPLVVAIGLVICDWKFWRGPAAAGATKPSRPSRGAAPVTP